MPGEISQIPGPFRVEATEDVTLRSLGRGIALNASGDSGQIEAVAKAGVQLRCDAAEVALTKALTGATQVFIAAGPDGSIVQSSGPEDSGPRVIMGKDTIALTVGAAESGASLVLTSKGILLKVGKVSFALSADGIEESAALVTTRKLSVTGHQMKAAETGLEVNMVGITTEAPIRKEKVDGMLQVKSALAQFNTDGPRKDQAGIKMDG